MKNSTLIAAGIVILLVLMLRGCSRITPTEAGFKINQSGDYRGIEL